MTRGDLHPAILEALGAHEWFRRIGFTNDQIFVGLQDGLLFTAVVRDGRTHAVKAGACEIDLEALLLVWRDACAWWNRAANDAEKLDIFEGSKIRRGSVHVLTEMVVAGFAVKPADA